MDSRFDIHIMLPPLTDIQLEKVRDILFANGVQGIVESTPFGSTLSVNVADSDPMDKTSDLMKLIVRELEMCMFCGGTIEYQLDHWTHKADAKPCKYGDELFKTVPAPEESTPDEGEVGVYTMPKGRRFKNPVGTYDKENLVKRMAAIGAALRHGFGEDWLSKRGEYGHGTERARGQRPTGTTSY